MRTTYVQPEPELEWDDPPPKVTGPALLRQLAAILCREFEPGDAVSLYEAGVELRVEHRHAQRVLNALVEAGEFDLLLDERLWVRAGASPNCYLVGARMTFPYAFSYGTALALHARQPLADNQVMIASPDRFETVEYDGITYRHTKKLPDRAITRAYTNAQRRRDDVLPFGDARPESVLAATPERALADCLARPDRAGGIDALIATAASLPELDAAEFLRWLCVRDAHKLRDRTVQVLEASGLMRTQPELRRQLAIDQMAAKSHRTPGKVTTPRT